MKYVIIKNCTSEITAEVNKLKTHIVSTELSYYVKKAELVYYVK